MFWSKYSIVPEEVHAHTMNIYAEIKNRLQRNVI